MTLQVLSVYVCDVCGETFSNDMPSIRAAVAHNREHKRAAFPTVDTWIERHTP